MPQQERLTPAGIRAPYWRALLEARWQARLQEVIELSLAYHAAAETADGSGINKPGRPEEQALLRRAVRARRKLEDVEEALGRLAAGRYGRCEQCSTEIPAGLLALIPETRYCPRCDAPPGQPGRSPR